MTAVAATQPDIVPTGLAFGAVHWGAHLCHFYQSPDELEDITVAYFAAGLANGEQCLWIVSEPLTVARARSALASRIDDLDTRIRDGQLTIVTRDEEPATQLDSEHRVTHWLDRERAAIAAGFAGLRITGAGAAMMLPRCHPPCQPDDPPCDTC